MKRKSVFILKGNIVYSKNQKEFSICENGYADSFRDFCSRRRTK